MRIFVSNPDNIGDLVLRQPMYDALLAAGHELMVVVRSFSAPLASLVIPGGQVLQLDSNPYSPTFNAESHDVRCILAAVRDFSPDIFCVAPYQRTIFEELVGQHLTASRVVGMNGHLYRGDINAGVDQQSQLRFDVEVTVAADTPEIRKNELLCGAVLGRNVRLQKPKIRPDARQVEAATVRLRQLGFPESGFWVVCAGDNKYTAIRNWSAENWARALSHAAVKHGWRLLFVGTPEEHDKTEDIRKRMGDASHATENICKASETLDTVAGLIHMSAGYIGRDTGPMHLAAAMGKPVVAAFGGGTWPRFIPAADLGIAMTVPVPCSGCDWVCHLKDSYCVKSIPTESMIEAIDSIEARTISGFKVEQHSPNALLAARMMREGAETFRELKRHFAASEIGRGEQREQFDRLRIELDTATQELTSVISERDGLVERYGAEVNRASSTETEKQDLLEIVKDMRQVQSILQSERDALVEQFKAEVDRLARTEVEKQQLLDIIRDMRLELSSTLEQQQAQLQQSNSLDASLEAALDNQRLQSESEKRDLLYIVKDMRKELEAAATIIDTQQKQIEAFQQSLNYAIPTAVRRIIAARGRRLTEVKTVIGLAIPVLRKRLGLANQ